MILVKVVSKDMVVRKANDEYDMILERAEWYKKIYIVSWDLCFVRSSLFLRGA